MKNLYKILFMLLIGINCFGQKIEDKHVCATDKLIQEALEKNPQLQEIMKMNEKRVREVKA